MEGEGWGAGDNGDPNNNSHLYLYSFLPSQYLVKITIRVLAACPQWSKAAGVRNIARNKTVPKSQKIRARPFRESVEKFLFVYLGFYRLVFCFVTWFFLQCLLRDFAPNALY